MRDLLVGLILSYCVINVHAQNEIVLLGAGTTACNKYLEALRGSSGTDKEMLISVFETWVKGYLSGRNKQLDSLGYKKVDLGSVKQLNDVLIIACNNAEKQGYGTTPVYLVVDKIFDEAFDKKLKK